MHYNEILCDVERGLTHVLKELLLCKPDFNKKTYHCRVVVEVKYFHRQSYLHKSIHLAKPYHLLR